MKTGVTLITIQHLIGVVIEATETNFTVSLEKFIIIGCGFALDRFQHFLGVEQLL